MHAALLQRFGLKDSQTRSAYRLKNACWYYANRVQKRVVRIGSGELSTDDCVRIRSQLGPDEIFAVVLLDLMRLGDTLSGEQLSPHYLITQNGCFFIEESIFSSSAPFEGLGKEAAKQLLTFS